MYQDHSFKMNGTFLCSNIIILISPFVVIHIYSVSSIYELIQPPIPQNNASVTFCRKYRYSELLPLFPQVLLLGRLHHRNLVNLVGYCEEKGQHILVYVYMSNGSLASHLYSKWLHIFLIKIMRRQLLK